MRTIHCKRRKILLLSKMIVILYTTLFLLSYLTSSTVAYFHTTDKNTQVIQTGTWWDNSDLVFIETTKQNGKACLNTVITAQIKNNGHGMVDTTEYEIYYIENGNPENEEKVFNGKIEPIEQGGTYTLSYHADKAGSYIFKAYQQEGYDNNYEFQTELWSEEIVVNCIQTEQEDSYLIEEKDKKDKNENQLTEDEKTQESPINNQINEQTDMDNSKQKQLRTKGSEEDSKEEDSEEKQLRTKGSEKDSKEEDSEEKQEAHADGDKFSTEQPLESTDQKEESEK